VSLEIGQNAPDFTLTDQHGQQLHLADLLSQVNVVLVFYPFAFTGVCTGELDALQREQQTFAEMDAEVLAVSCDSKFSLRVFAEREGLDFRLLSDFWPHGEVARAYGVLEENLGAALRGTFVIDRTGLVRWKVVNSIPEARDIQDYVKALADL